MSVILEFSVEPDEFVLGRTLAPAGDVELELERIVPTTRATVPFVWAFGGELTDFERRVEESPHVESLSAVDRLDTRTLYRLRWAEDGGTLLAAIDETEASVLEGRADGVWSFRLRFYDQERLSQFHEIVRDRDVTIQVDRTDVGAAMAERDRRLGLSTEQHEALELALRRGYFATPSEVELDELADELEISRQAVSDRIRRGNETILRRALRSAVGEDEYVSTQG